MVMTKAGAPKSVLELRAEHPRPVRGEDEVLIEAVAAGLNAGDYKVRQGMVPFLKVPKILGEDVAGIVLEAPADSKFKPGDRVFGGTGLAMEFKKPWGCDAEYVCAKASRLVHIPEGCSFEEAAAVPTAALTAWQAMQPCMPLEGKRVLVHAASSGVGSFAVQFAKAQGAHVTTTCSTAKLDFATKQLGADVALDYKQGPWDEFPECKGPFDLVVDVVGGIYEYRSLRLLKKGGHLASINCLGWMDQKGALRGIPLSMYHILKNLVMSKRGRFSYCLLLQEVGADKGLQDIADLIAQGKVKVPIDRVFPLEELAAAHEYAESGQAKGKIVISIKQEGGAKAAPAPQN